MAEGLSSGASSDSLGRCVTLGGSPNLSEPVASLPWGGIGHRGSEGTDIGGALLRG